MTLTGYGVCAIVGNWAFSFLFCSGGGAGKLFDKFWLLAVGFLSDLAMCLTATGWPF